MKKITATHFPKKSLFTLALVALFFMFMSFRGSTPATSELHFSERSLSAGKSGSVIPASCDSNVSHFGNPAPDCPTICINSTNALVNANTVYNGASNSCVCANGKTHPPLCDTPADPKVSLSFTQPPNPVVTLTSDVGAGSVSYGGATTLRWDTTQAASCIGSWGGVVALPSGSFYTGTLRVNKTYTLTCTGSTGIQTASTVAVAVDPYTPPICNHCIIE